MSINADILGRSAHLWIDLTTTSTTSTSSTSTTASTTSTSVKYLSAVFTYK